VQVVVKESPDVARQFDAAAFERMARRELRGATRPNPRPLRLVVNIDSTDELFSLPHQRLKSGREISWRSVFDSPGFPPVRGGADAHSSQPAPLTNASIRLERFGQPVVVGTYAIIDEADRVLELKTIVLLANDPQFYGPRAAQQSIRVAAQYLADRVMLIDQSRLHTSRVELGHSR
jgi:hypothetical protein